jgi:hypothetical protein
MCVWFQDERHSCIFAIRNVSVLLYEFSNKRYYDQITHKSYDKLLIYSISSSYDKYSIVFVLV